jgi:hypothetical protein
MKSRNIGQHGHWIGLSIRVHNCLHYFKIKSRIGMERAVNFGVIYPGCHRNYGKQSHLQLLNWLDAKAGILDKLSESGRK